MKNQLIGGISIAILAAGLQSCNQTSFPKTAPSDFKIEYRFDGGNSNESRTIVIQMGECSDKGIHDNLDFSFAWSQTDNKELEKLYQDLKKLNAFSLNSQNKGDSINKGGESVVYVINKKEYKLSDIQANFIPIEHEKAFKNSIVIIKAFSELHRQPVTTISDLPNDSGVVSSNQTNTKGSADVNKPQTSNMSDDQPKMSNMMDVKNTGIPPKMSNDFSIQYEMSGGISGTYRNLTIQYGTCTDKGKKSGESKYETSWLNKNIKDYENLYNELYKLDAFSLEYTTKGTTADRGGEKVKFTINKKEYVVSDKDNDYIKSSDKTAFKKTIGLIVAYADNK